MAVAITCATAGRVTASVVTAMRNAKNAKGTASSFQMRISRQHMIGFDDMTKMNRRAFLGRTTALAATAMLPIPRAMALVAPESPPLYWFAVGHGDEWAYPMLAENLEQAMRYYAHEYGHTKGESCPECDEPSCTEHLSPSEWNDPVPWIEEYSEQPAAWSKVPIDREPTNVEWLKAGYNVPCEDCDYGEPDDCYEFEGRALCCDCLDIARTAKLDDIIGNGYPTMFQGKRMHG